MAYMTESQMDLAVEAVLDTLDAQTEGVCLEDRIAVLDMVSNAVLHLRSADRSAHRQAANVKPYRGG